MRTSWKWLFQREKILNLVLLTVLATLCLGARPACRPPPNLDCDDFTVYVEYTGVGLCVDIQNPCSAGGDWANVDHFRLYQEPDGFFIRGREGAGGTIARQICVADGLEYTHGDEVTISYLYTKVNRRRRPDYGEGFVTVVFNRIVLRATATADPMHTSEPGEAVQLDVEVIDGSPPYTYLWMSDPFGEIDPGDVSLKNPVVHPDVSATYTIVVTDSQGDVTSDSVEVSVGFNVTASADADTIDIGESVGLHATVVGGTPPYTYDWVPLAYLDDATIADPVATLIGTQMFEVTARDNHSGVGVDVLNVFVRIAATVTATPEQIPVGQTSQLEATVAGGAIPYSYSWSPSESLDDSTIRTPVASPTETTTYVMTVTDADGVTAQRPVTVTVGASASLEAFATTDKDTVDVGETAAVQAFASGGTPPYHVFWNPSWVVDNPDDWAPTFHGTYSEDLRAYIVDATGEDVDAFVRVSVRMDPQVEADPPAISPGESSRLLTTLEGGGQLPYTYSWSPAGTLDDASAENPLATPTETTEYVLVLSDVLGQVAIRTVTVEVTP